MSGSTQADHSELPDAVELHCHDRLLAYQVVLRPGLGELSASGHICSSTFFAPKRPHRFWLAELSGSPEEG